MLFREPKMTSKESPEALVLDASAMIELLIESDHGQTVGDRIGDRTVHVPAHFDAEVLSGLSRMFRAGMLSDGDVGERIRVLGNSPFIRHTLTLLLEGAWSRRENFRLADALNVELAERLNAQLLTADRSLARAFNLAEYVGPAT